MKYRDKKCAVVGFGMEGRDLTDYLLKREAEVTVFDKNPNLEKGDYEKRGVEFRLGEDYLKRGLGGFEVIFRSPGVRLNLQREVRVSSAMNVFFEECPAKIIGVTGTKGKGTTSTLIYEMLKKSGKRVYLAGNIGEAYLALLNKLKKSDRVVLEMSSFQLIDLRDSPQIAVVLMIATDHLDWHKDRAEYVEAKKNIVRFQKNDDFRVLNWDERTSRSFENVGKARKFYFSIKNQVKGAFVRDGRLVLNIKDEKEVMGVTEFGLRGKHNWENITAASCAACLAGASLEAIKKVAKSFRGLEHRLEYVGKVRGVKFFNDSFSTNPETAMAAAASFEEPLTLIMGGSDKGLSYRKMAERFAKAKNLKQVILMGAVAEKVAGDLKGAGFRGRIEMVKDMEMAVARASRLSKREGVVVLSPASASFDMFENYKERGKKFKESVAGLKGYNK